MDTVTVSLDLGEGWEHFHFCAGCSYLVRWKRSCFVVGRKFKCTWEDGYGSWRSKGWTLRITGLLPVHPKSTLHGPVFDAGTSPPCRLARLPALSLGTLEGHRGGGALPAARMCSYWGPTPGGSFSVSCVQWPTQGCHILWEPASSQQTGRQFVMGKIWLLPSPHSQLFLERESHFWETSWVPWEDHI